MWSQSSSLSSFVAPSDSRSPPVIAACSCSSMRSCASWLRRAMPALLTSTSTSPKSDATASNSRAHRRRVRDVACVTARLTRPRASATLLAPSSRMSATATRPPRPQSLRHRLTEPRPAACHDHHPALEPPPSIPAPSVPPLPTRRLPTSSLAVGSVFDDRLVHQPLDGRLVVGVDGSAFQPWA